MISPEILVGVFSLALVAMITPGPNNLVALSLSVRGDLGRAARACCGIIAGTICLAIMCWFGAASVFEAFPAFQIVLVGLGCAYLVWGGISLFFSVWRTRADPGQSLPSSFWGLAAFQFTNPKAWVLCVAALSALHGSCSNHFGLIMLAAIFGIASAISLSVWVVAGRLLPFARTGEYTPPWVNAALGLALIGTSASLAISVF